MNFFLLSKPQRKIVFGVKIMSALQWNGLLGFHLKGMQNSGRVFALYVTLTNTFFANAFSFCNLIILGLSLAPTIRPWVSEDVI